MPWPCMGWSRSVPETPLRATPVKQAGSDLRLILDQVGVFSQEHPADGAICVLQVTRMEGQVTRYKSASENAEKVEDELKAEKRRLQREVCPLNDNSMPMF